MNPQLERRRLLSDPFPSQRPALFLDRDGVLIEDKHHIRDPGEVELCSGAQLLLQQANQRNWPVVVITNQSGIERGYFDWESYERVNDRILELLGVSAPLAAIYANGHGPQASTTSWRKPNPAMLLAAADDLNIDLNRSILVGDRFSDIKAGASACLPWLVHVLSGHGKRERPAVEQWACECAQSTSKNLDFQLVLVESLLNFPPDLLMLNFEPTL
jgi:D-glycero-D-manno-heptose 1,7-bisphosphate phosphatase